MRTYLQFKVVEINLSTGIRIGHIIAQQPFKTGEAVKSVQSQTGYIDNGGFFRLDKAGEVVMPGHTDAMGPIYFQYTEELLTDRQLLADYGLLITDYPRLIQLYKGDVFTTNNYELDGETLADDLLAYVAPATGQLTMTASLATLELEADMTAGVATPVFHVTKSTLPDGTTVAAEFLYIADFVATT